MANVTAKQLSEVIGVSIDKLLDQRYQKLMAFGQYKEA